jgi:hypothetical protein
MSFRDYCALPGINFSRLKLMDVSALHYRTAKTEETDPMRLGRAAHSLTFEPETFEALYTVWEGARNSNAWKAFRADNEHLTILTADQHARALGMADAVRRHPIAKKYMNPRGKAEQTLVWTDEATGLVCKARADFLSHWCAVVDLKSAADLSPRFLSRAVSLGYPCQMAHYRNGAIAQGIWAREPECVIVAVESKPPYDVGVFRLDEETLEYGTKKVAELLAKVKECTERNEWPGRYPDEQVFGLPEWAKEPIDMTFEDTED